MTKHIDYETLRASVLETIRPFKFEGTSDDDYEVINRNIHQTGLLINDLINLIGDQVLLLDSENINDRLHARMAIKTLDEIEDVLVSHQKYIKYLMKTIDGGVTNETDND